MQVETFQNPWELQRLVDLVEALQPARTLEIGAWHGGTLRYWLQHSVTVVVVDDEMRREEEWRKWERQSDAALYLVRGFSQDTAVVAQVDQLGPYDFVFIDGDHTYSAVRADWENFSPMVNKGGVIAFHDIVARPGYGVSELWGEVRSPVGARWVEIVQNVEPANESKCGIGVMWL